ncbi:MAG: hypothetical protein MMC23_001030 [Stictis urceolatum]|nr:hypothetical protein [Stictis urceolata]
MAICTRHPFLHIYKVMYLTTLRMRKLIVRKPLLLLALEEYFKAPTLDTLEQLYDSVNSMDLSLMPRLSLLERHILQATDNKEIFMEKFDQMIQQRIEEEGATHYDLRSRYQLPRDTHEYETRVMYNSIPIPIKVPTAVSPETVGDFSLVKLITTFSSPHTSSPQPFALHPHLTTNGAFTHPILVLVNAVLTQKRVVFLGHNRPSGEVAEAVLAACALVSGSILRGFTRHAFPYTDLTKIDDLLNVPGFIAGVTNPTFANHHEWWDLLCDIPSGRMKISSKIEPAPPTEGLTFFQQQHPTYAPSNTGILPPAVTTSASTGSGSSSSGDPAGDAAFMEDILRSIASRHGEPALRSKFRDYIVKFTRLAAAFEEAVYGASALHIGTKETEDSALGVSGHGYVWPDENTRARELAANVWRIEGWRMTRSYYALIQDLAALWGRKPIRGIDVEHHLERLRFLKLGKEESRAIFTALDRAVAGYDEVCQLLVATPESHAGLFYLSLGLWHPKKEARVAAAGLLERVRGHEAGRHFWSGLGRFAKVAFMRVRREAESEGVDGDVGGGMSDSQVFRPRTRGRD